MFILSVTDRHGFPLGEIENPSNLVRSFLLNKSGQLTFELGITHPKADRTLLRKGNLVICYSDETGTWSGEIVKVSWHDTTVSITCFSIEQRLSGRLLEPLKFKHAAYGEIFRHIIGKANQVAPTGIYVGDVFMGGDRVDLDLGAQKVYDKLTELLDASKLEYRLDMITPGTWEMSLYEKVGSDLTDRVFILTAYDLDSAPDYEEDWSNFANGIWAVGKAPDEGEGRGGDTGGADDGWTNRPKVYYQDEDSIGRYGLVQDIIEVDDISDLANLKKRAIEECNTRKRPRRSLGFVLTERRDLWGQFGEGDIITVQLAEYGYGGLVVPFKVQGREISEDTDTMSVTGEVLDGEQAQTLHMFANMTYSGDAALVPASG